MAHTSEDVSASTASVAHADGADDAVVVTSLQYAYPDSPPLISDFTLRLPRGSRCLLIGANGAGKSTLLQILGGKFMVGQDVVRILGRPAFHDLLLTSSGDLGYLGAQWRRDVGSIGGDVPMQADIGAGDMIHRVEGVDPDRRQRLIDLLDIDLSWRLNRVSDGQRRRVQICMGLLKPYKVLLLDEITVDLDVVGRLDLLDFFQQECDARGACIVYATHIFDGLESWITHVAYVENGKLLKGGPVDSISELQSRKLFPTVEAWLRKEKQERLQRKQASQKAPKPPPAKTSAPFMPSKHMAFYRG
ncbi:hypothetical protein WJX73_001271 [Symbiochloris irregularis]|uniref:ABC transporter domain-containing protein n=1 Tax=Symbiochloris irregularis TaxID=706552 RepID=A0AAW1NXA9_9CHLO